MDHKALHTLYCSLVLPYLSHFAEVWGNNYKNTLYSLFILQKRAICYIHKAGYRDHTYSLFLQSKLLKFTDQVACQTAQVIFMAEHHLLLEKLQKLFTEREGGYNLRGNYTFKTSRVCTTRRGFCVSVIRGELWSSLNVELKECTTIKQFKKK